MMVSLPLRAKKPAGLKALCKVKGFMSFYLCVCLVLIFFHVGQSKDR